MSVPPSCVSPADDVGASLEPIFRCTDTTTMTKHMVAGLISYTEVDPVAKENGITN